MNILIYEWKNFGIEDICDALKSMSHTYKIITDETIRDRTSPEFDKRFDKAMNTKYDCVFSFNYSPLISNNCNRYNIPYIAFVYDSPLMSLYSYTIINPCNYVFIFDKKQYLDLRNEGIQTVYYAPLAVNTKRLIHQIHNADSTSLKQYQGDISFVGSLYNEKHNLFDKFKDLPPYVYGYLDAIMHAQIKVYGYFFIDRLLRPDILKAMQKSVPISTSHDGVESIEYLYSNYFLARKMASIERHDTLKTLSKLYNVNLYTPNATPDLPDINNCGPVDYYDTMPYIFHESKINLNISLRSIQTGIPLRCMDIMGAGGFLLSNYQADFYDLFEPGHDVILYESLDDCIEKCKYYLSHESERQQIAANGFGKICESHTYEIRLSQMFDIVFN